MRGRYLLAALALALAASPAAAQRVATGISHDTIRVGDPFRAVVRIDVAPGTAVVLPDSLPAADDIENAGKVRMRRDSTSDGVRVVAAYPLTAWRPGELELPALEVVLHEGERERPLSIALPALSVVSVLPADTTGIEAKPMKDVLGGNRVWWPWLLLALLLLSALAAAYWWWRKRRAARVPELTLPVIMPRERALEELERIRKLRLVEQGEYKRFYTLVSEIVRRYMASLDPEWGGDLTTEELAQRTQADRAVATAISVLRSSDYVKFARATPSPADAFADWEQAHGWISAYPPAPPAELEAA